MVVQCPFADCEVDLGSRRVAVTGAAGFIGSHVVAMLADAGAEVTAIDDGPGRRPLLHRAMDWGGVALHDAGPWPYRIDDGLVSALRGCDTVVHLAFRPVPVESVSRAAHREIDWNVRGTLDLVRALGPETGGLCFASSTMVYDSRRARAHQEPDAAPRTPYGVAKLTIERYLDLVGADLGMAVTSLRFATVYGRWETAPRAVPLFLRSAATGRPITVRGGSDTRDYVHVQDVARAVTAAVDRRVDGVCNVGTGVATRTDELAELVVASMADLVGQPVEVRREDDRPATHLVCDPALAARHLDVQAQVPLQAGLADAASWTVDQVGRGVEA